MANKINVGEITVLSQNRTSKVEVDPSIEGGMLISLKGHKL